MYPETELTFVNVQNPNDVVAPALRHRIRSRAAFHTHECRLKTTLPLQLSQSVGQYNVLVPRYAPSKDAAADKQAGTIRKRLRGTSTVERDEVEAAVRRDTLKNRLPTTFASAPVPYRPWHADLLDMWNNDAFPKYWEATKIHQMMGVEFHDYQPWMRRASMTDPTLYYIELLAALTIAYPNAGRGTHRRLFVETELCGEINHALGDPDRRFSTMTLVVIARFAFHEFTLGNRDVALNVHLPGFARMLEMNGGMGALGKDVPQMVTDLLRLHTWLIIDACEPGGFLAEPDRIGYQEPAYNLTAAERDSCTQDDVNIKKEEPQRDRLQHQQPQFDGRSRTLAFLRQIAWQPPESKSPTPCEQSLRSFWAAVPAEKDFPADFANARRLELTPALGLEDLL